MPLKHSRTITLARYFTVFMMNMCLKQHIVLLLLIVTDLKFTREKVNLSLKMTTFL